MSLEMDNHEFQTHAREIEELVERVNRLPDDQARSTSLELLQSMMDLHGAAMSRVVELLSECGETGRKALAKLGADPLICGLMVLYGVHPESLDDRVRHAIEKVGPQLQQHGGRVELLAISDTAVRLRVQSSGHGCGSSPEAIKETVEQAIREAAPEVVEVFAEGVASSTSGFVPVNMIQPATKEEKNYEESAA